MMRLALLALAAAALLGPVALAQQVRPPTGRAPGRCKWPARAATSLALGNASTEQHRNQECRTGASPVVIAA